MLVELRKALSTATLIESAAAIDALTSGWLVEEAGVQAKTTDVLAKIYKTRAVALASRQDHHSQRLASSAAEFSKNLSPTILGRQGQWLKIHQNTKQYFLCYVVLPNLEVVGCMFVREASQDVPH